MSDDPVERAARAMFSNRKAIPQSVHDGWDDLAPIIKGLWLSDARAAIASLRKPSDALIDVIADRLQCHGSAVSDMGVAAAWTAAIDAVLSEPGSGEGG
jgi:hypothetical protein